MPSDSKPIKLEGTLDKMAQALGTYAPRDVELKTEFHRGVEGITVDLIDWPTRPYRTMYDMATATWTTGSQHIDKWDTVTPEARHQLVKAVLDFRSLPNSMEAMTFSFGIQGCTRSAFDQIVRARVGAVFSSMGGRDANHSDIAVRVKESVWRDPEMRLLFQTAALDAKDMYHEAVNSGVNWQNARDLLPLGIEHRFAAAFTYLALRNFMGKRLKACEQEDTTAVAWLMRERVKEKFPLLATHLVPTCDVKARCDFHDGDALSILFRGCGRWPDPDLDKPAIFNESCSDYATLAAQTQLAIPTGPDARSAIQLATDWEELDPIDQARFRGEG